MCTAGQKSGYLEQISVNFQSKYTNGIFTHAGYVCIVFCEYLGEN